MASGTSLKLELLVHTFLSTTLGGATGNSGRMDKGCPFPYLFRVQSQTQNLFQILYLFLSAFLITSFYLHLRFHILPMDFDFSSLYEYIFIGVYKDRLL
jgi:hypothetical protein